MKRRRQQSPLSVFNQNPVQDSTEFLNTLFADYPRPNFQVRFWDHRTWGAIQQPSFTLVLKHPGALREMFLRPSELTLGEAYIFDDFDIEGDIEASFEMLTISLGRGLVASCKASTLPAFCESYLAADRRATTGGPPL